MNIAPKKEYSMDELLDTIKTLRSPHGCPWDRKQTHKSIRRNFIEETYEAVEAIDNSDMLLLREELGDVLLQVLLHSQIASEAGAFTFSDVCSDLCNKLIFRHPHVFGDAKAEDADEALKSWDAMKREEKEQETVTETLTQVSKALPALIYSEKVQKRASRVGFDYSDLSGATQSLYSELEELEEAINDSDLSKTHEELGDVLFSAVNISRFISVDAEKALYDSTNKFVSRFSKLEELALEREINIENSSLEELDLLWNEVKRDNNPTKI